jgi:hypothetical protein
MKNIFFRNIKTADFSEKPAAITARVDNGTPRTQWWCRKRVECARSLAEPLTVGIKSRVETDKMGRIDLAQYMIRWWAIVSARTIRSIGFNDMWGFSRLSNYHTL